MASAVPVRVLERGVYRGPHLYGARPMVRIQIDLGELEAWPTDRIEGFTEALLAALPGLAMHGCCYGEPGGFLRRLESGTWFGHVAEHVALELQKAAGASVTRGKTRSVKGRPGVYNVMYAYADEATGLLAGRLALQILDRLLPERLKGVEGLDRIVVAAPDSAVSLADTPALALPLMEAALRRGALGPTTQALVDAARRRGIPAVRLNDQSLIQLGQGANQRRLRASVTDRTGLVAAELAGDKAQAKALLDAIGCPVARGAVVRTADEAVEAAGRLRPPVVLKPLDGNHGRGVTTGLTEADDIRAAFGLAAAHSRRVIVEEQLPGTDHRILVVAGQVVAVAERVPAHVVGDGVSTIAELVDRVNADPRRGEGHAKVLTRIRLDDAAAIDILAKQDLAVDAVPEAGRFVALRTTANLSSGGTAVDRTDEIHPENASIARRAALAVGLDVAGIDMLAPDITRSIRETGGGIVEVNAAPGLRMHLDPSEGQARDVAAPIIRMMFPKGSKARIPVLAVTGTNGKSTVGRMVAHILRAEGLTVGLTNTSGVYIGDERVFAGDASGPKSARLVLRDPTVQAAVLECARGGILREGLAFDRCDVGAVLNVQADHLGLKGIDTLEDLAAVKAVVSESVGRRGVSVLNADDPLVRRMARHAGGRLCWFSMGGLEEARRFLRTHISEGGLAVLYEAGTGEIVLHQEGRATPVCRAADIPATLGGHAAFNVANALAAIAMTHAVGIAPARAGAALASFASTYEQNPGRLNLHEAHGVRILMDYAHNPDGLRALGDLVRAVTPTGGRSIAMLSVPGDRRDAEIVDMGRIGAEYFDQLVFRETPDNRGRPTGEVIRMMTQGAADQGAGPDRVQGVVREEDAVAHCLAMARPNDLVVLTPTRIDSVWAQVLAYTPATLAAPSAPAEPIL
ncbi:MAG: cyanophycin synthetase, partial [Brevundimonas sp.]